jgi:hypothetical protein
MSPVTRKYPIAATLTSGDACGCAMSARFLGVTLIGTLIWFAVHRHEYSLTSAGIRILIFAFAGAFLGKLAGIAVYRLRRMNRVAK